MAAEITDERIAAVAQRLHSGDWSFSPRQLYYAVCADVETPPVRIASGEVGLGLVLILIGIITANRTVIFVMGGIGLILVLLGVVTHLQERRPLPPARLLAVSFAEFEEWLRSGAHEYPGLIVASPPMATPGLQDPRLVICDRAETVAVLTANRSRLANAQVLLRGDDRANLEGTRVVVVHDCDPAGCALAADLRDRGAQVVDAGINPGELTGKRSQILEGAPARLPRDLAAHLDTEQTDWLRSGKRLELATEPPEQLVMRVRAALEPAQSST